MKVTIRDNRLSCLPCCVVLTVDAAEAVGESVLGVSRLVH